MATFLLVLHMFIAIGLIALVLLQRSEGGALGMGGGGPGGLMSGRAAGDALTRGTQILGAAFICTSIALAVVATTQGGGSVADRVQRNLDAGEDPFPADLLDGIVAPAPDEASGDEDAPLTPSVPLDEADEAAAAEAPSGEEGEAGAPDEAASGEGDAAPEVPVDD